MSRTYKHINRIRVEQARKTLQKRAVEAGYGRWDYDMLPKSVEQDLLDKAWHIGVGGWGRTDYYWTGKDKARKDLEREEIDSVTKWNDPFEAAEHKILHMRKAPMTEARREARREKWRSGWTYGNRSHSSRYGLPYNFCAPNGRLIVRDSDRALALRKWEDMELGWKLFAYKNFANYFGHKITKSEMAEKFPKTKGCVHKWELHLFDFEHYENGKRETTGRYDRCAKCGMIRTKHGIVNTSSGRHNKWTRILRQIV